MEGKQYEDSSTLSGYQGSLSAVLWPERVGFLLELWRYTPISKVYDSDLTSSQETQEPKKETGISLVLVTFQTVTALPCSPAIAYFPQFSDSCFLYSM